jgi:hypothetical protein
MTSVPHAGSQLATLNIKNEVLDPAEFESVEASAKWNAGATLSLHGSAPRDEPREPVAERRFALEPLRSHAAVEFRCGGDLPVGDVCRLRQFRGPAGIHARGHDVENLFDESYYPNACNYNNITPGSPLAVHVGVTANFQSGSSREA